MITSNAIRGTFALWHDRVIAGLMLVAALSAIHVWFAAHPWSLAAWTTLVATIMIGISVGRLIATRLAFHAFDGLLAADALRPPSYRHYMAAWHGVVMTLLVALTLIARPSLMVISVPGYLAGVVIARLSRGLAPPKRIIGTIRPVWKLRKWSHRPVAGLMAALILLSLMLPARTLGMNMLVAIVGIETVLLALMLIHVDDAIVRFMTITGHGSVRIIVHHAGGIATFLAVSVCGCWLILEPVAAGIVAAAGIAMLLLLIVRILAYRLHGKRFADVLVSIASGFLMLVAYSMPVALPVIVLALLWQFERRGRTKMWLLA